MAANHFIQPGGGGASDYADLEFLAGFIALRRLDDPTAALGHFRSLLAGCQDPDQPCPRELLDRSRGRGCRSGRHRQLSRPLPATRPPSTAFSPLNGWVLSLDAGLLADAPVPDWQGAAFRQSSVVAAAELLLKAGDLALAKRFLLHLAESQDETGLAQLADMVTAWDEPHLEVLIGKAAAERGLILPDAYYPVPDMVPDGLSVSRALALAIARRESEFDPAARSSADARGLMQVLPGTAKIMAERLGKPFEAGRLTSDPAYNVVLGAAYLAQMAEEFGPSIALIASGYNAGPGRPRRWIGRIRRPAQP